MRAQDSLHVGSAQAHSPMLDFQLYSFQEFPTSARAEPPALHRGLFQGSSGGILLAAVSVGLSQRWDVLFVLKKLLCIPQPDLPSPVLTGTAHSCECAGCWEISRGREFTTSFPCRCAVIQRCLLNPYRLETQSFLID